MAEYIERDAVIRDLEEAEKHKGMGMVVAQTLKRYVKRVPAADVVKEVHARWYHENNVFDDSTWVCSSCFEPWILISGTPSENNMNYCPKCGAIMDLDAEHGTREGTDG